MDDEGCCFEIQQSHKSLCCSVALKVKTVLTRVSNLDASFCMGKTEVLSPLLLYSHICLHTSESKGSSRIWFRLSCYL